MLQVVGKESETYHDDVYGIHTINTKVYKKFINKSISLLGYKAFTRKIKRNNTYKIQLETLKMMKVISRTLLINILP